MLVGTAITGQSASPPMTLARAPPSRNGDDDVGAHELLQVGEQPVQPRHPTSYRRTTSLPRASAVRAASSATGMSLVPPVATTFPAAVGERKAAYNADAAHLVIGEGGRVYSRRRLDRHAGDEDGVLPAGAHGVHNAGRSAPGSCRAVDTSAPRRRPRWLSSLAKPSSSKGSIFSLSRASSIHLSGGHLLQQALIALCSIQGSSKSSRIGGNRGLEPPGRAARSQMARSAARPEAGAAHL